MSGFVVPFIEISPITKLKTVVYTKMQVLVQDLCVGQNAATIKVILWTELQDEIKEFYFEIQGDEYKQWTDDLFLLNWVKAQLKNQIF
jgi:hypothetical protein